MTTKAAEPGSPEIFTDRKLSEEDAIDLREYVKILRKYRWPIMFTTALLTSIAAFVVSGMAPVYRATSTLLIETQQTMPINLDEIIGIDTTNKEYYQTQFEVLRSRKLARRVVREMGLFDHPELSGSSTAAIPNTNSNFTGTSNTSQHSDPIEHQLVINRFIQRTSVIPLKNTKMVRISFDSQDPIFAAKVANKIADTYILSYLDSRVEMGEKATSWLTERLTQLKVKLEQSQYRLLTYKEENGLVDIQGDNNRLSEQEIGIITSKLLDAESKAAYAKILYDEVSKTKSKGIDALLSLPTIGSNEMVRRYKLDLQETQFKLDELGNRYGEKHPKVVDAVSRQNTARSNLYSQIDNIVDSIEKDYLLSSQTAESLRVTLNAGKKQLQQSDRSTIELLHLEREVQINQELYDTFYTRSREVDEAENMDTANAQIAEYAEAPLSPISPKKTLITLLTLLLSAAASFAIAVLRESTDQTVASTEDVEARLGARMLGILPLVSKQTLKKSGATALVPGSLEDDKKAFEESIRTIRTSICLEDLQQPHKVIMVTSALPSEGKSTLASHLAYSLSNVERVLLIECDLRRPSLQRAFNFQNDLGLAQLLGGDAKFAQCMKPNAIGNLDVIPAGSIPERPLDLLTSKRFTNLIALMRKHYDRIIIDSAPVQAVSDALLLGQFADAVLYAVKANSTPTEVAARGVNRMRNAGINIAGVVVSQVNLKKLASYGGELDYQGYYDYYGYSEPAEQRVVESTNDTHNENQAA